MRLEEICIKRELGSKYDAIIENIKTNVLSPIIPEEQRVKAWTAMQNFLLPLDKYRNRDIFTYLPFMKEYWI